MASEELVAVAVLAALNTALSPKVAYDMDDVPATRPDEYVEQIARTPYLRNGSADPAQGIEILGDKWAALKALSGRFSQPFLVVRAFGTTWNVTSEELGAHPISLTELVRSKAVRERVLGAFDLDLSLRD